MTGVGELAQEGVGDLLPGAAGSPEAPGMEAEEEEERTLVGLLRCVSVAP